MRRSIAFIFPFLLLLSGCVTRFPLGDRGEALLASLYKEGGVLVTVDAKQMPNLAAKVVGNELVAKRVSRISVLLTDDGYPLDFDAHKTILLEGSFPSLAFGIAMGGMEGFEKQKGGYWQGEEYSIGLLEKGVLMITDSSWLMEKERLLTLPQAWAPELGSLLKAPLSCYAKHPTTFFSLGYEIPQSLIDSTDTLSLRASFVGDILLGDVEIVMEDEEKASALNKVLRSLYVKHLRLCSLPVDLARLRAMFTMEGNLLTIHQIEIPASMTGNF